MKVYESYLKSAVILIQSYDGKAPFASWLKSYFSQNKKFGSTDRKQIAELCYSYYRLGGSFKAISIEEKICLAVFLCNGVHNAFLHGRKPEWNKQIALSPDQKLLWLGYPDKVWTELFPWKAELSDGVDHMAYSRSFLTQPDLFIRLRPGFESGIKQKLSVNGVPFQEASPNCLALKNGTKLEDLLKLDREYTVQDFNSQKVGDFFSIATRSGHIPKVWDCCAGSGGKSLLAYDLFPNIDLTVSDNRSSILKNLKKRFAEAGIHRYTSFVTDLSTTINSIPDSLGSAAFDLILADLPCSGSGVWSRTPEQLVYFDKNEIRRYSNLQKNILSAIASKIKQGGYLVYITCSVFRKENEEIVDYIRDTLNFRLEKMELLKGYDMKADSMFVAKFQL